MDRSITLIALLAMGEWPCCREDKEVEHERKRQWRRCGGYLK